MLQVYLCKTIVINKRWYPVQMVPSLFLPPHIGRIATLRTLPHSDWSIYILSTEERGAEWADKLWC